MGLLTQLIGDLICNGDDWNGKQHRLGKELREYFNEHPAEVIQLYGLSNEATDALASMDRDEIINVIEQEVEDWQFPDDEFPATDPNCPLPEGESALYPDPEPDIHSVDVDSSGNLTIRGEGFIDGVTKLALVKSGNVLPPGTSVSCVGTFRCSTITFTGGGFQKGDKVDIEVHVGKGPSPHQIKKKSFPVTK